MPSSSSSSSSQPPAPPASSTFSQGQYDSRDSRRNDARMKERDRREREAAEYKRRRNGSAKDPYVSTILDFPLLFFLLFSLDQKTH